MRKVDADRSATSYLVSRKYGHRIVPTFYKPIGIRIIVSKNQAALFLTTVEDDVSQKVRTVFLRYGFQLRRNREIEKRIHNDCMPRYCQAPFEESKLFLVFCPQIVLGSFFSSV